MGKKIQRWREKKPNNKQHAAAGPSRPRRAPQASPGRAPMGQDEPSIPRHPGEPPAAAHCDAKSHHERAGSPRHTDPLYIALKTPGGHPSSTPFASPLGEFEGKNSDNVGFEPPFMAQGSTRVRVRGELMLCTVPSPSVKPKRSPAAQGASGCTEELRKPPGHTSPRPRSTQRSPREGSPAPQASGCAGGRPHRTESLPSSTVLSQGIAQRASQGTAGTTPAWTDRRTCGGEQDKQAVTPQKRRGALPSISRPAEPSRPKPPPASPAP